MIAIGTNASALMAQAATASVQIDAETAMQRLSSGKRINAAKDDAAGVAIASRMTSHVKGLHQSIRNSMDAQALIGTAEGGLQETEALLQRIRELAVQASNDTNSDADRTNLNNEAQQLLAGIDAVASGTTWAGQNLLDGTYSNKGFQVGGGSMAADQVTTSLQSSTAIELGLGTLTSVNTAITLAIDAELATGQSIVSSASIDGKINQQLISLPKTISLEKTAQNVFSSYPSKADVTVLSDDRFIVVQGNRGQLYDASGDKEGNSITFSGSYANVEALPDGGFVVAVTSSDKLEYFNSQGVLQNAVNVGFSLASDVEVSINDQGNVFVLSKNNNQMVAQLFSKTGELLSGSFLVPGTANLESYEPRDFGAAHIGDNKFLISWIEGDDYNNPPEIIKATIIDLETLPQPPNSVVKNQLYSLSSTPSSFTVFEQPNGYEVESLDVFALSDGTAWISYGIEIPGYAGDVDGKRYDSNGQLVQDGKFGPVSREYITNTNKDNNDILYFEDTAVRREVTLNAPNSNSLAKLRINRNNIYAAHGKTTNAVAANSDQIFMLGNTGNQLSREIYKIQQSLSSGSYNLSISGVNLSGNISPASTDQANDLVLSFKSDPDYDANKFELTAIGGNIVINFKSDGVQSPVVLTNSSNSSTGIVSELQGGQNAFKEIDLSSFNFDADGYRLNIAELTLVAPPKLDGDYDVDSLISALKNDKNYDSQLFSISKNSESLKVEFINQSSDSTLSLNSLPLYSVDLSDVDLNSNAYNLSVGQIVLTAPALETGKYSVSSLANAIKEDSDYDNTKHAISVNQGSIEVISLDGLEYNVSLENTSGEVIETNEGPEVPAISLTNHSNAQNALTRLDTALQTINSQRAELGSLSNRLDHIIANNMNASTNAKASLGRIQDADFAAETTRLAKFQIIQQAATAMLAQANASQQNVLSLIQD